MKESRRAPPLFTLSGREGVLLPFFFHMYVKITGIVPAQPARCSIPDAPLSEPGVKHCQFPCPCSFLWLWLRRTFLGGIFLMKLRQRVGRIVPPPPVSRRCGHSMFVVLGSVDNALTKIQRVEHLATGAATQLLNARGPCSWLARVAHEHTWECGGLQCRSLLPPPGRAHGRHRINCARFSFAFCSCKSPNICSGSMGPWRAFVQIVGHRWE
jgi:hypothetical protein